MLDTCRGLRPQRNMSNSDDDDDDNYLCFSLVTGPAGSCNFFLVLHLACSNLQATKPKGTHRQQQRQQPNVSQSRQGGRGVGRKGRALLGFRARYVLVNSNFFWGQSKRCGSLSHSFSLSLSLARLLLVFVSGCA